MSILNLFSKQQKALKGQTPEIYQHDNFPRPLRVQIIHILERVIEKLSFPVTSPEGNYQQIHRVLCEEYGEFSLANRQGRTDRDAVLEFFLNARDVNQCLDVIQLTFVLLAQRLSHPEMLPFQFYLSQDFNKAVDECNQRFKEHGVGFELQNGQILRIDSEFTHQELTVPALNLLRQPYLQLANQEFMTAHDHFRHGRHSDCVSWCLKAFESAMKAICHKRKWPYNQNDSARPLIKICEDNNLFPVFMESHLTGLRTTLESGVPTARNKTSGHGQGVTPTIVSEQFASYVLNLTAANIRFLAESEQALK